ncbi:MAG TPA: hypothetical protein VLX91_10650 [Candidatus Acidoferrales bacterium]|nr:hypothetical protein [Candidatus Acidoferrales bacterium]
MPTVYYLRFLKQRGRSEQLQVSRLCAKLVFGIVSFMVANTMRLSLTAQYKKGVIMSAKTVERLLAVLLLVVWVLLLVRARALNPAAFSEMQAIIILGSLAVLVVVVLSFAIKHRLPVQNKAKDNIVAESTNK